METQITGLSELIETTHNNLVKHQYDKDGIHKFELVWETLMKFLEEKGISSYEPKYGLDFLHCTINYPEIMKQPLTTWQKYNIRAIRLLNDFQLNNTISKKLMHNQKVWDNELQDLREELIKYSHEKNHSKSTTKSRMYAADRFLEKMIVERKLKIAELTSEDISKYIAGLTEYSKSTVAVMLTGLRFFFEFSYKKGYIDVDLSGSVPHLYGAQAERVPHVLSADDVRKILSSIDRGSPIGKRNYAILVMAAMLGMRDSDITNLTFENLDWEKSRINFYQKKTGKPVNLPLIPTVGEAIIDYLKYGRPDVKNQYVFLKHKAPFNQAVSFYSVMTVCLNAAGIKVDGAYSRGLHILRHTLASELIHQGEAYSAISAILGHTSSSSTDTYSHVDIDGLLKCALDLKEIAAYE